MSRGETMLVDVVAFSDGAPGAPAEVPVFRVSGLLAADLWVFQADRREWRALWQMRGVPAHLPKGLAAEVHSVVAAAWPGLVR